MSVLPARWRVQPGYPHDQQQRRLREHVRCRPLQCARLGDQRFFPLRHERRKLDRYVVHRERYAHEPEYELRSGGAWAGADLSRWQILGRNRPQVHGEGRQCCARPTRGSGTGMDKCD
jgi:hypothetical protein